MRVEGTPVTWTNYFIDVPTHEEVLRSVGFREVRWHPPELSPQGRAEFGEDYWRIFMEQPPVTFIECIK